MLGYNNMEEDMSIRRSMEASDLPKLPEHWRRGDSFHAVAWRLYQSQIHYLRKKLDIQEIKEEWDNANKANPLLSLYTYLVMIPVGGSFCCKF
jgi:hypothetical protein